MQERVENHYKQLEKNDETDFRLENLRKIVYKQLGEGNLLDLGCGAGHMTIHALKRGRSVTAVDVSEKLLMILKRRSEEKCGGKLTIVHCSGEEIQTLGQNTFDNVISLDVLEHIEDDEGVLKNMNYVLKNDGILILSLPAMKSLWGFRDEKYGHYRRYSKDEIITKLQNSGFKIMSIRYWNFLGAVVLIIKNFIGSEFNEDTVRRSSHPLARMVNGVLNIYFRVFENNLPLPFGLNLIIVAKKRSD